MALDAGVVDIADVLDASAAASVRPLPDQRLPRQAAVAERGRGDRLLVQHRRRQDGPGARHRGPARLFRALRPARAPSDPPARGRPAAAARALAADQHGDRGLRPRPRGLAAAGRRCDRGDGLHRAAAARPSGGRGGAAGLGRRAAGVGRDRGQAALADVAHGDRGHRQARQGAGLPGRRQDRQRRQARPRRLSRRGR